MVNKSVFAVGAPSWPDDIAVYTSAVIRYTYKNYYDFGVQALIVFIISFAIFKGITFSQVHKGKVHRRSYFYTRMTWGQRSLLKETCVQTPRKQHHTHEFV